MMCVCPGFRENSVLYSSMTCSSAEWTSLGRSSSLGLVLLEGKAYGNSSSIISALHICVFGNSKCSWFAEDPD